MDARLGLLKRPGPLDRHPFQSKEGTFITRKLGQAATELT
jgi:hypothetical protein